MSVISKDKFERVEITTIDQLWDWLACHHTQTESIWLVTYKKAVADKYVPYSDIVDTVLCFGWIDSVPRKLDDSRTMLRLSPRRDGSAWSRINKDKIARLEAGGLLQPSAVAKICKAKQDGSWMFLDNVDALIKPEDLIAELALWPEARENFDGFSRSSQRGILEWIKQAKRSETRTKRIKKTAELAEKNIKANHPK